MRVDFGTHVNFDARGKHGTSVRVSMDLADHGWMSNYHFDTHGMTPDDIARRVADLRTHHAKKCIRLDGFADMRRVLPGGYRLVDCNVWERAGEVELYLDVRDGGGDPVDGFPLTSRYATIDDVPDDGTIISMVRAAIDVRTKARIAQADVIATAKLLLRS